ncbi:hypothetical protein C8J57DRAFT_1309444 [Mycena rebaudengoi]|nr:hypothetical protein C8J57DRAFT_1309444 [Mycena rebaudengoi]
MLLDGLRDELAELELSIAHRQSYSQELESRKAAVQEQLAAYAYPILTLPPEIGSEIFLQCLPGKVYPIPSQAPLSLLGICRAWNTLTLSTPALWTRLDIDREDELELGAEEKLEEFIRTWFARGQSLPLSFHFSGELARMNEILHDHAAYLSDFHLYTTDKCLFSLRGGATFPMLRELEIEDLYMMTGGSDTILDSDVFRNAPHLRRLRLIDVPLSLFTFPWSQLTEFTGIGIDVAGCLSVLEKSSSLCELDFRRGKLGDSTFESPLVHHSLLSLQLRLTPHIIHFLRLPALKTLHMRGIPELLDDAVVLPFLASMSLQTFTFGETPTVSLHWLHRMQQLTTLELYSSWAHKDELLLTLNRANEPQFLPQLRNFALLECEPEEINERLLNTLHIRAAPAEAGLASLQTFSLIWPDYPLRSRSCIHSDKLRELVALGLTIHVGTSDKNYL